MMSIAPEAKRGSVVAAAEPAREFSSSAQRGFRGWNCRETSHDDDNHAPPIDDDNAAHESESANVRRQVL